MGNYFIIHGSFSSPLLLNCAGHINSERGFDTFEDTVNYLY